MFYPEGLMHRKINIWLALLIIAIIAGIFAAIISAKAVIAPGIGIVVVSPPIKCVLDPCPGPGCAGFCLSSCGTCGSLAGLCNGMFEVKATYLSGTQALLFGAGGPALCLNSPMPPLGGSFRPGAQCLGNIYGFGPHLIQNFACF